MKSYAIVIKTRSQTPVIRVKTTRGHFTIPARFILGSFAVHGKLIDYKEDGTLKISNKYFSVSHRVNGHCILIHTLTFKEAINLIWELDKTGIDFTKMDTNIHASTALTHKQYTKVRNIIRKYTT